MGEGGAGAITCRWPRLARLGRGAGREGRVPPPPRAPGSHDAVRANGQWEVEGGAGGEERGEGGERGKAPLVRVPGFPLQSSWRSSTGGSAMDCRALEGLCAARSLAWLGMISSPPTGPCEHMAQGGEGPRDPRAGDSPAFRGGRGRRDRPQGERRERGYQMYGGARRKFVNRG